MYLSTIIHTRTKRSTYTERQFIRVCKTVSARSAINTANAAQVLASYVTDLEQALAPDRLAAYRPQGGNDLAMVTTYFWNMALSRELMMSLGVVEITMRNGIHHALTAYAGRADWYDHLTLLVRQSNKLVSTKAEIANARKQVIPGRVIAGLDFGFWTSLLSSGYGTIWTPNNAAFIGHAFPHLPLLNQSRGYVHRRFNTIRKLRNRISHHEPIWRGVTPDNNQPLIPLAQLYNDIIDAIGWVSPVLQRSVKAFDRFPVMLHTGHGTIEAELKQHLGIP